MIFGVLALLLAAGVGAQGPESVVSGAMSRADEIVAREPGKDAREIAELDRRARSLFRDIAPLGWRAAAPLGEAAKLPGRTPKARLLAAVFLSKLRDPAAYRPLSDILLDEEQDADVRLAAAQGLAALDVTPATARAPFCAALSQPGLPRTVADEALIALARLGCDDPDRLEGAARAYGLRPKWRDLISVRRAIAALGRSRGEASARALLRLAAHFPPRGEARAAAIAALGERRADLSTGLTNESYLVVRDALRDESSRPDTVLVLIELADAFDSRADELFPPLLSHPDAEVLASASEALARRKIVKALPALEALVAGAMTDPRFAPRTGRPDPALLLARAEAAARILRAVRSAAR